MRTVQASIVMRVSLLLCFMLIAEQVQSQCLSPVHSHDPVNRKINPDSVMVDTCDVNRVRYARGQFEVRLTTSPLSTTADVDTEGYYDISDFDSAYVDFESWVDLVSDFSAIRIKKAFDNTVDSNGLAIRTYVLKFVSNVPIDSIARRIRTYGDVEFSVYKNRAIIQTAIPTDPGMRPNTTQAAMASPGTSTGQWHKRLFPRGWQRGWYDLHMPMAWEITKGSSTVYAGVDDNFNPFYSGPTANHQDLTLHTSTPAGNYFYPGSVFQGSVSIAPLQDEGHGYQNLHIMAGQENSVGLVGIAPLIRVFGTTSTAYYSNLDVSATSGIQHPHIMTCPYKVGDYKQKTNVNKPEEEEFDGYILAMMNGIVIIGGVDNQPGPITYDDEYVPYDSHLENGVTVSKFMLIPTLDNPGRNVYYDENDSTTATKDVKVLSVASYFEADNVQLADCSLSFRGVPNLDCFAQISYGLDKFNNSSNAKTRTITKSLASIDVVMPPNMIGASYDNGSKYDEWIGGNSRGTAMMGGIVGLMMSVHDRLGLTGINVQRRVYDIVTFTADKILDRGLSNTVAQTMADLSDGSLYSRRRKDQNGNLLPEREYGMPNQGTVDHFPHLLKDGGTRLKTEYMEMTNDALGRYWAPRFGFGRPNAFRCLAHSIPGVNGSGQANVKYQYSGSDALDWSKGHALSGTTYLHLGKFKNATQKVLDAGGVAYTGEPAYMNNNGKTLVDVDLSVGAGQSLVIDGILTTSLTSNFKKITTSSTGKILVTGWVDNVDLEGLVRTSDLRIKRTSTGTALKTTGASELHDTTWLRGSGDIVVSSGTLTLQPGATVFLYNGGKIIVKAGAELKLMHGSRILDMSSTKLTNRVILESGSGSTPGGKLTIESKAEDVVIDAEV